LGKSLLYLRWVGGEWSCGGKEFSEGDSHEDENCSEERTAAKMLVQHEVGSNASEDGFEGEEDGGVGGGEVLLGPALDGESGSGRQEAGYGQSHDKARGDL
jgi:hypothetical protein